MLNAAIVGYGGIAKNTHSPAWKKLEEKGIARLVAAYDIDESRFSSDQKINIESDGEGVSNLRTYTDLDKMLAEEKIDLIDVCVPTFLHASITEDLLRRGYPVHCEKPMARTYEQCLSMINASKESGKALQIGLCLRFLGDYVFLRDAIKNETFGKPLTVFLQRLSLPARWGWEGWYADFEKSGGCLMDMHIHDVDMVRFLLGEPDEVSCRTNDTVCGDDTAYSQFFYKDGPCVLAVGDWSFEGRDFTSGYDVAFENATVVCRDGVVTVYPKDGEKYHPEVITENKTVLELENWINVVVNGVPNTICSPEESAKSIKLYETLKQSAVEGGKVISFSAE